MRNEAEKVIDALDETFLIGRSLGIPVVISNKVNIWREISDAGAGIVVDIVLSTVVS